MTGSRLLKDTRQALWPPDDSPVLPYSALPPRPHDVWYPGPRSCYYSATAPLHLVSSLTLGLWLV